MRNAIKYYYDIDVDSLKYEKGEYLFDNYILKEMKKEVDINLYNFFIGNHIYLHHIIYNNRGEYATTIDKKKYILLQKQHDVNINMQNITMFLVDINVSEKKDWSKLWEAKVDYYEKNIITQRDKECMSVFPYYIGLSELAIRLYKEIDGDGTYSICHDRLISDNDFYSPDNIITDYKVRDIAEYIKISFFNETINLNEVFEALDHIVLTPVDYQLLYSRLLFPTYFYDCLENNENLSKYTSKINQFEDLLNEMFYYLKVKANIPKIDWLIKKV